MIRTTFAYKFVFIVMMMSRVNYYAPRLHLPIDVPVQSKDIRFLLASSFIHTNTNLVLAGGGRIDVKNYTFTIDERLKINYIRRLANDGKMSFGTTNEEGESSQTLMERASRMNYSVSTNDLYQMATNWLVELDIDVSKLEAKNPPTVNRYPTFYSKRGPVPTPIPVVDWHDPKSPGFDPTEVEVEMSAVTGGFLELADTGGSFSKAKPPMIMDMDKLLAIPDEEFLKYSPLEKSNLVVRFTGLHYPFSSDTNDAIYSRPMR